MVTTDLDAWGLDQSHLSSSYLASKPSVGLPDASRLSGASSLFITLQPERR